jgi:hypothetical protein
VAGWPLLAEEDAALLAGQAAGRREDGWEEVAADARRDLHVHMQARPGGGAVKTAMASAVLARHSAGEVFDALADLAKHRQWDLTWQAVEPLPLSLGQLDAHTSVYYFVADPPPAPYSYLITQRDFCMFRGVVRDAATGMQTLFFRNGGHAGVALNAAYIRGETLGAVGFMVTPCAAPPSCRVATTGKPAAGRRSVMRLAAAAADGAPGAASLAALPAAARHFEPSPGLGVADPALCCRFMLATAADPKGAIPAAAINFIARRTPSILFDRLAKACDGFRAAAAGAGKGKGAAGGVA